MTSPENPWLAGSLNTGPSFGVAVSGGHAFVAAGSSGLVIVDISDPENPAVVGSVITQGGANRVAIAGNYAYVAEEGAVAVAGSVVCVATRSANFEIVRAQCEPAGIAPGEIRDPPAKLLAFPNPTTGGATIRLVMAVHGSTRATIYDVVGRRVRELPDAVLSHGVRDLLWDGRDNGGGRVAPGVYIARVATCLGDETTRVVVLP